MEIKTVIEVQQFADFDMVCTKCIMVSNEKFLKFELLNEFCNINNIPSIKGLDCNKLNQYTEDFVTFLELKGFTELKTFKVLLSD